MNFEGASWGNSSLTKWDSIVLARESVQMLLLSEVATGWYRVCLQDRQPAATSQTCGVNPGTLSGEPIRNGIWKMSFMLNIGILWVWPSLSHGIQLPFFSRFFVSVRRVGEEKTSSWAECLIEECSKEGCRRMENWVFRKEHADDYQAGLGQNPMSPKNRWCFVRRDDKGCLESCQWSVSVDISQFSGYTRVYHGYRICIYLHIYFYDIQ